MLTTPRLIMTPFAEADADFFYAINDDRTDEQRASAEPWPNEHLVRAMEQISVDWTEEGLGYQVVRLAEAPDQPIGIAGVRRYVFDDREALNLYYHFVESAQGHGYAYEACAAALETRGAAGHGHLPVVAFIDEDNAPSRRLAEKLGLVWEGRYNSRGRCVFELPQGPAESS